MPLGDFEPLGEQAARQALLEQAQDRAVAERPVDVGAVPGREDDTPEGLDQRRGGAVTDEAHEIMIRAERSGDVDQNLLGAA